MGIRWYTTDEQLPDEGTFWPPHHTRRWTDTQSSLSHLNYTAHLICHKSSISEFPASKINSMFGDIPDMIIATVEEFVQHTFVKNTVPLQVCPQHDHGLHGRICAAYLFVQHHSIADVPATWSLRPWYNLWGISLQAAPFHRRCSRYKIIATMVELVRHSLVNNIIPLRAC